MVNIKPSKVRGNKDLAIYFKTQKKSSSERIISDFARVNFNT